MKSIRQKRQACEPCRARKLKCPGEKTGCSRCLAYSITCRFQDQRRPGRPRKRPHLGSQPESQPESQPDPPTPPSSCSQSSPGEPPASLSSPSFLFDLPGTADLDFGLPLVELPRPCQDTLDTSVPPTRGSLLTPPSCDCAERVSSSVRALRRARPSHSTLQHLRDGAGLAEVLLTCPICYDLTKPPRVTIQNVLLIGRLMLEVTSGYHRYLHWLRAPTTELAEGNQSETVYLLPGPLDALLGFKVSGQKLQELIVHGLQVDVERLSTLGREFALRQHNRHMVGHEACPDAEGRCWREEYGGDEVDPLEVCPQNCTAKSLTPCYRVVEDVWAAIEKVADAVA